MIDSTIRYNGSVANSTDFGFSMPAVQNFQLAVWQSISRHLEVSESTSIAATLLARHVPLHAIVVHRVDAEHRRVRVIASGPESSDAETLNELQLSESTWRRLDRWMRQQTALHRAGDPEKADAIFSILYPNSPGSDWLIAPLDGEHGSRGI